MSKKTGTNKITAWLLTLAMFMTALSGFSITAFAAETASGTCGENLTWTLDDEGTLTISGTGAMADYGWEENLTPWAGCEIKTVVVESGVETIGDFAFYSCSSLTSVTIPESVETIGDYAFTYCSSLTSVTISSSVEVIGKYAFSGCTNLSAFVVSEDNTAYSLIDGALFTKDEKTLIKLPPQKDISEYTIPNGTVTIADVAFEGCSNLTSVAIPSSVKTIGAGTFLGCSELTSITIPEGVETIGNIAFGYCTNLSAFVVSEDNTAYSLIGGALFTKDEKTLITLPPKMDISEYTIPDSTVTVADAAFSHCSNLTSVTIPSSVKTIGVYAFYRCSGLTSVVIPSTVNAINDNAFSECNDIIVYMESEEPASLGSGVFKSESDDTIIASKIVVPVNAVAAYKEAWVEYADIIEPESVELENPFTDVSASDWYYEDVIYAVENGLFNGTTKTTFAPDDKLTRAMLVTVLYRAEGDRVSGGGIVGSSFEDVDSGEYYANAVSWAKQNGIVSGVTENEFAPNDNITREQIAAIMFRYAQYKGYDVSVGDEVQLANYDDFGSVHQYAISSVKYAIGSGILKGRTDRTLNTRENATRAETAAILHRFFEANN